MITLNDREKQFIIKRRKLVQSWYPIGVFTLISVLGLGIWLFITKPLLANPFIVIFRLENNLIPSSTLALMAGLLPIVILTCLFLMITMILFIFVSVTNEKKYLNIINKIIDF